ncbi:MAG TPA: GDSL-type esterase/lipase family protein [Xanthobacteraceae bacterium]|jgi:acyl-CoA thioesterase-1|nr:GDSL-type esterase/lipase family protein [Xanthobacteraceae bacterium]
MPLRLCVCVVAALWLLVSPLQARPLSIVAIGASNTSGFGVGEQNAYPAVLERLLRQKGIDAHVTNAGVLGDVTAGMRNRLDAAVPKGTDIVILQPGGNDLRFFGTKEARTANIAAMTQHLHVRGIRVIVYDPNPVPRDFYQWDGIHFNAAAHAKIAATLAVQITATIKPSAIAPDSDAPNAAPANMAPATTDSPNTPPARTTPSPSKP